MSYTKFCSPLKNSTLKCTHILSYWFIVNHSHSCWPWYCNCLFTLLFPLKQNSCIGQNGLNESCLRASSSSCKIILSDIFSIWRYLLSPKLNRSCQLNQAKCITPTIFTWVASFSMHEYVLHHILINKPVNEYTCLNLFPTFVSSRNCTFH